MSSSWNLSTKTGTDLFSLRISFGILRSRSSLIFPKHEIENEPEFILVDRLFCGPAHEISESFNYFWIKAVTGQNNDRNCVPIGIHAHIGKDLDPVPDREMDVKENKIGP